MKRIFKKSAIGLAILGLAGSACAGTITGAFIGGEGLDLQPRNGDLDFVAVFPAAGAYGIANGVTAIHPGYAWGFRLYAGLKFCGNDDLTVSWMRDYASNSYSNFPNPAIGATAAPRWLPAAFGWTGIYSKVNFNLDDVYAEFGHTINLYAWSLRYAGGVEWARLNSNFLVDASTGTAFADFYGYQANDNTHGFGPRVAFDATYHLPYGLGVFAKGNAALLIASRNIELVSQFTGVGSSGALDFNYSTRRPVIPKFGLKLGLGYGHAFGDVGGEGAVCNTTVVTVEAGWQVDTYIHAIERPDGFNNTTINAGSLSNVTTKTSNYGLQGLFLGARLSTGWF